MLQPKVISVTPMPNKLLLVEFSTGESKIFDVKPYIFGSWYSELNDDEYFQTVCPCGSTVAWSDGQDIAPHELYELSLLKD